MVVSDLIKSALISLRVVPPGGGVPGSWSTMALTELNAMLQLWAIEGLHLHALTVSTPETLVVGDATYTIGASGNINDRRPVEIVAAKLSLDGVDYPLAVFNSILQYQRYLDITTQSRPCEIYYDSTFLSSLATLWLYPTPDQAYSLTLHSLVSLAPFTATSDTVTLPPEYEMALSICLAARMIPTFPLPSVPEQHARDGEIRTQAKEVKSALFTNNSKRFIQRAKFDGALLNYEGGNLNNVLTGV